MRFLKKGNIYMVTRVTGNQNNILGISFAEKNSDENTIEVIEWSFPKIDSSIIRTSKDEVLTQVLSGLNPLNEVLETNYQLSKIYYLPSEHGSNWIYQTLIRQLIKYYRSVNEFGEIV